MSTPLFGTRRLGLFSVSLLALAGSGNVAILAHTNSQRVPAGALPSHYIEPPVLAPLVASGKLPPIGERLPKQPVVVGPGYLLQQQYEPWQDGQYGGTILDAATFPSGWLNIAEATILRSPGQTTEASRPNIVSQFSYSPDYKTFHFTIRPGLRWSDGVPVTTADVRYTFDDIYGNPTVEKLDPWPVELCADGNCNLGHAQLTVQNQYSFTLSFTQPYGYLVADLNSWVDGYDSIFKPAHYLEQFDKRFATPAALSKLLKQNNMTNWVQLLVSKDVVHWNIGNPQAVGMPVLNPWVVASSTDTQVIFKRNPYYFQVDSHGRQLPYINEVVNNIADSIQAQTNAELAGQMTIASGGELNLDDMPVYEQNAKRGGYRVFLTGSFNDPICLYLNQDYQYQDRNSTWQKLITDPQHRFARALSAAMNPENIDQTVYFGLYGKPFFNDLGPNPTLARSLLNSVGMKYGTNGFRLGPDGKPFVLTITYAPAAADFDPVAELLRQQIQSVGIQVQLQFISNNLFAVRPANQLEASLTWNDGPRSWGNGMSEDFEPGQKGGWSPATWEYFASNGAEGRKPPAYIQTFYNLDTTFKHLRARVTTRPSGVLAASELDEEQLCLHPHHGREGGAQSCRHPSTERSKAGLTCRVGHLHQR